MKRHGKKNSIIKDLLRCELTPYAVVLFGVVGSIVAGIILAI